MNVHTNTLIHTHTHRKRDRDRDRDRETERDREIPGCNYYTSGELIGESQFRKALIHQEIIEGKVSVLHYSFIWLVKN